MKKKIVFIALLCFVALTVSADEWGRALRIIGGVSTTESFVVAGSLSSGLSAERLLGCDAQDLVCTDPGANGTFAIAFLRTATLGANPTLAAGECTFATTGVICEGSGVDISEALITFTNPTADRTYTFPDASGTVVLSSSAEMILKGSASINFTAQTSACEDSSAISVSGAIDGNSCDVGVPAALWGTGDIYSCYVSSADNVKVRHCNFATGSDPGGATTINVSIFQ